MQINKQSNKPYYEQIVFGIKEDILKGILIPGDKIPSVRDMAALLLTNPNTVSKAYKELEAQDVILTVRGRGTFVKDSATSSPSSKQMDKIKTKLQEAVVEALYFEVPLEEIQSWVKQTIQEFGGEINGNY
ncbi:GntR family transcriptional regulator [Vagococcus entomophilus]|uniref:GntR family transcriptional regulator n=1 Tax=Vagococcus entomophilus TaxID=1160095 RepID=A0A430AJF1_9ENTE|nr:GntR family transcriptional regulator [Vagococcus entomophilus]RSU08230.1 GntR family transcriptional regulator [Vagococcus entomophilus]